MQVSTEFLVTSRIQTVNKSSDLDSWILVKEKNLLISKNKYGKVSNKIRQIDTPVKGVGRNLLPVVWKTNNIEAKFYIKMVSIAKPSLKLCIIIDYAVGGNNGWNNNRYCD